MASSSSSSSNSPCAACKFLRRKCTQTCVFAPYFPPDQPAKFANVHRVFGASNVSKLLNELPTIHREDAVNSLAYEAEARLRDPVYGCVGCISSLQSKLRKLQEDLVNARKELASYIGAATMAPPFLGQAPPAAIMNHHQAHQSQQLIHPAFHGAAMAPGAMMPPPMGVGLSNTAPQPQQPHMMTREQLFETMQLVNAAREQELFSGYEQQNPQNQQQQLEFARYAAGSGFDGGDSGGEGSRFNHLASTGVLTVAAPSSELALVPQAFDNSFQVQQQQHHHHHHHQQQQQQEEQEQQRQQRHHHHQRTRSDKERSSTGSVMGPSC